MAAKLKKRALAEYNSQVVHVDPQLQEKRLKITGGDSRYVLLHWIVTNPHYIFGCTATRFFSEAQFPQICFVRLFCICRRKCRQCGGGPNCHGRFSSQPTSQQWPRGPTSWQRCNTRYLYIHMPKASIDFNLFQPQRGMVTQSLLIYLLF